jgi:cell division protein ZapA (FtsZ GTPase activity inhibitor)
MFDAKLLNEICGSEAVFWAGIYPPVNSMVTSTRIFDPECDFRQSCAQHGTCSAVYLVEYNLGQFKQWPLILDEALRLLPYGKRSTLFVRFSQSALLSVFAFAAFLRRRKDFSFELIYQDQDSDGTFVYAIYCTRENVIPTLATFEFALITDGRRPDKVTRFIDSVARVRGIDNIDWRVAICGPTVFGETLDRRNGQVRFIEEPDQHMTKGWITRKKNLIVETTQAENLLIAHDRYEVPVSFLDQLFEFGADFSVITPAQIDTSGKRFPDWVAIGSQWSWTPCAMLQYGDYSPHSYVNGGAIISKRRVLTDTPWSNLLFWNQGEDVELTRSMTEQGVTPRLARLVKLIVTDARPGYIFDFMHVPPIPHAYAVTNGDANQSQDADPSQITISSFNVGNTLDLRNKDLSQLAAEGIVAEDTSWGLTNVGLTLLHHSAELAINIAPRGEGSFYLEVQVPAYADSAKVHISANGTPLELKWSDDDKQGLLRATSLMDQALAPAAPCIVLSVESTDAIALTTLRLSARESKLGKTLSFIYEKLKVIPKESKLYKPLSLVYKRLKGTPSALRVLRAIKKRIAR